MDDDEDENDTVGCWVNMVYSCPTLRSESQWKQTANNPIINDDDNFDMMLIVMMMMLMTIIAHSWYQAIYGGG